MEISFVYGGGRPINPRDISIAVVRTRHVKTQTSAAGVGAQEGIINEGEYAVTGG